MKKNLKNDLTIKEVDKFNLKDSKFFCNTSSYLSDTKNFMAKNRGFYGYINDNCVTKAWVSTDMQPIFHHKFYREILSKNEAFIHGCETAKEYRGKGFYPYMLSFISNYFTNENKKVFISTFHSNLASRKGIEKAGFVEVRRLRVLVLFGIKFIKENECKREI